MLLNLLSIVDELNKLSDELRKAITSHTKTGPFENPIFWIGAICVGFLVFKFTYSALQKEK